MAKRVVAYVCSANHKTVTAALDAHVTPLTITCPADSCGERAIASKEQGGKDLRLEWQWSAPSPAEVNADERLPGHLRETSFFLDRIDEERAAA